MNVTFLSDNPMNSAVVDLAGGGHLYNITTEHTESSGSPDVRSTTTVSDPAGAVVAVWERTHTRERDRITFRDKMHVLGDWLPKKSPLSKTRILVVNGGERYHWKQATGWGSKTLKLIEPETGRAVAEVRAARHGGWPIAALSSPRRMSLSVIPELVPMLVEVVLSLVILYQIQLEHSFQYDQSSGAGPMGNPAVVY